MNLTIDNSTVTINGTAFACKDIAAVIRLAEEIQEEENIVFPHNIIQAMLHLHVIDECEECGDVFDYSDRHITGGGFVVCPVCASWHVTGRVDNDLKFDKPI